MCYLDLHNRDLPIGYGIACAAKQTRRGTNGCARSPFHPPSDTKVSACSPLPGLAEQRPQRRLELTEGLAKRGLHRRRHRRWAA